MQREELLALSELAGDVAGGLTERIHETHEGIARRVFDAVGPGAALMAFLHDGIAGLT